MGEDVVYDGLDHVNLQADGPKTIQLAGSYTIDSFSKKLEETQLFPAPPVRGEVSELYRRWAFESAALDLALRPGGPLARRRAGARAAAGQLRGVDAARQLPAQDEPETPDRVLAPARALPGHAS